MEDADGSGGISNNKNKQKVSPSIEIVPSTKSLVKRRSTRNTISLYEEN